MENYVQWERRPVQDFYHIYSDGTRVSVLFEIPEDKVYARNLIAVLAYKYHILVYCDVIMDTHLHLVGHGKPEDVSRFEAQLKRQLAVYFSQSGRPYLLKEGIMIDHEVIQDDVELMQKIIYVFRNPMDAGYPYLPEDYPWGVGRIFFHPLPEARGRKAGEMTEREKRILFRTRTEIPDEWLVDEKGMLLPRCYIDIDAVHQLFGSPKRFIMFLFVRKKDIAAQDEKIALSFVEKKGDAELHAEADQESHRIFGRRITKLSQAERLQVAGILWRDRRTLSRKQLARAVRMDAAILEAVFH